MEPSQGLRPSRAEPGAGGRAKPAVEMLEAWTGAGPGAGPGAGAWTWACRVCTGSWLEISGVVVAIGCIVMNV